MKEWIRVNRDARGRTTVTVTMQDGEITVKWSTVAFARIAGGIKEGRERCRGLIAEVHAAMEEGS